MSKGAEKQSTKERIIEVAQGLFAAKGLDGTSMRDITDAAGVNLASVNYHFGSKDGLISAVFQRHLTPINEARLAMLDAVEAEAGDRPPELGAVLEAFMRPVVTRALQQAETDDSFLSLMGRCLSEPPAYTRKHIYPHFTKLAERFNAALTRVLPELAAEEVFWRLIFIAGSLHYALHTWSTDDLPLKPKKPIDAEELTRQLICFAAAGFKSKVAQRE